MGPCILEQVFPQLPTPGWSVAQRRHSMLSCPNKLPFTYKPPFPCPLAVTGAPPCHCCLAFVGKLFLEEGLLTI